MKAFKVNQMLNEASIADLKAELKSSASGPQPQYERPSHHHSVEWKFIETSTEDGQLDRTPVNRNDYTSHGFLDAKGFGATISSIELKKGLTYNCHNETKELNSYTFNDGEFSRQFSDSKTKAYLPSIDSETLRHEYNAARVLESFREDDRSEAENNQANKQQDSHETETNVLEDREYWQAFIQDMKLRRRCGDFPPPLTSLSGKGCSHLPHQPACVQLQRIRSKGRFVLQEVRTLPVVSFRPIRSQGRLVLQLIHPGGEDAPLPLLSTKPSTEKLAAAPTSQMICMARAENKVENFNYELPSQFEQTSKDIFTNQKNNMPPNLGSSDDLDKNDSLPISNLNKKEATESINREDMYLSPLNTANSFKEPLKACSGVDDDKCSSKNRYFNRENHRRNSCSMPEELLQTSEFNFKQKATCSADFLDNHSSEKSYFLDNRLARKNCPKPYEKVVKLNNPTQSLLQLSAFKMRNVMRGADPASSSLRCKRSQRREEDYTPVWESRCVASS